MNNVHISNREKAMEWWNTLRNTNLQDGTKDKGYYTNKYFNGRMFKFLTGREIEIIYNLVHKKQSNNVL